METREQSYQYVLIPCEGKKPVVKDWTNLDASFKYESYLCNPNVDNMGVLCGPNSDGLEVLDFDYNGAAYSEWKKEVIRRGGKELLEKLPVERTPSGGYHVAYRCDECVKRNVLASAFCKNEKGKDVLIEVLSEGSQFIFADEERGFSDGYKKETELSVLDAPKITPDERNLLFLAAISLNEGKNQTHNFEEVANIQGSACSFVFKDEDVLTKVIKLVVEFEDCKGKNDLEIKRTLTGAYRVSFKANLNDKDFVAKLNSIPVVRFFNNVDVPYAPEIDKSLAAYFYFVANSLGDAPKKERKPISKDRNGYDDYGPAEYLSEHGNIGLKCLLENGWKTCSQRENDYFLTRPGKDRGVSAVYHLDTGVLYNFSTSVSKLPWGASSSLTIIANYQFNEDCSEAGRFVRIEYMSKEKSYLNGASPEFIESLEKKALASAKKEDDEPEDDEFEDDEFEDDEFEDVEPEEDTTTRNSEKIIQRLPSVWKNTILKKLAILNCEEDIGMAHIETSRMGIQGSVNGKPFVFDYDSDDDLVGDLLSGAVGLVGVSSSGKSPLMKTYLSPFYNKSFVELNQRFKKEYAEVRKEALEHNEEVRRRKEILKNRKNIVDDNFAKEFGSEVANATDSKYDDEEVLVPKKHARCFENSYTTHQGLIEIARACVRADRPNLLLALDEATKLFGGGKSKQDDGAKTGCLNELLDGQINYGSNKNDEDPVDFYEESQKIAKGFTFNLISCIQPSLFKNVNSDGLYSETGLLPRFAVAYVPKASTRRLNLLRKNKAACPEWNDLLFRLTCFDGKVRFSEEAKKIAIDFFENEQPRRDREIDKISENHSAYYRKRQKDSTVFMACIALARWAEIENNPESDAIVLPEDVETMKLWYEASYEEFCRACNVAYSERKTSVYDALATEIVGAMREGKEYKLSSIRNFTKNNFRERTKNKKVREDFEKAVEYAVERGALIKTEKVNGKNQTIAYYKKEKTPVRSRYQFAGLDSLNAAPPVSSKLNAEIKPEIINVAGFEPTPEQTTPSLSSPCSKITTNDATVESTNVGELSEISLASANVVTRDEINSYFNSDSSKFKTGVAQNSIKINPSNIFNEFADFERPDLDYKEAAGESELDPEKSEKFKPTAAPEPRETTTNDVPCKRNLT